jgi:hypothetical protein
MIYELIHFQVAAATSICVIQMRLESQSWQRLSQSSLPARIACMKPSTIYTNGFVLFAQRHFTLFTHPCVPLTFFPAFHFSQLEESKLLPMLLQFIPIAATLPPL